MTSPNEAGDRRCDLYRPGHLVHWIQARKAYEGPANWGKLAEVDGDWITVSYLDRVARYRSHDLTTVADIAEPGAKVRVSERFHLLNIQLLNHLSKGFCVALETDAWTPCSFEPLIEVTPEALAERLETRGGFSVSGELIARWPE